MEVVRTSETSVDNNFTRQYIPEDNSELADVDRHFKRIYCLHHYGEYCVYVYL
jgi:hypothetical protein